MEIKMTAEFDYEKQTQRIELYSTLAIVAAEKVLTAGNDTVLFFVDRMNRAVDMLEVLTGETRDDLYLHVFGEAQANLNLKAGA
jgi:hypothetical protein